MNAISRTINRNTEIQIYVFVILKLASLITLIFSSSLLYALSYNVFLPIALIKPLAKLKEQVNIYEENIRFKMFTF